MRGKEKLIPHAARAGRWLEEQSWASALPSFYLASSQRPKRVQQQQQRLHWVQSLVISSKRPGSPWKAGPPPTPLAKAAHTLVS